MNFILMTKSTFPIIGWFADFFGWIMDILYGLLNAVGIQSLGVAIVVFTILTTLLMLPMTISQQKFMKLSNLMQPELKAIQAKYRGKTDNASVSRMNAETQAVYERYGVSPSGSCLPLLLQFPIMLGLYQVIVKVPAYITSIKATFMNIVTPLMQQANFATKMEAFADVAKSGSVDLAKAVENADVAVDLLYKFTPENWVELQEIFPEIADVVSENLVHINEFNSFLGMNLAENPALLSLTILVPILAGLTQYISTKQMTKRQTKSMDDQMAMMNNMNTMMPIMSVVFCFMLPIGVGVYWIAGTVTRMIIQIAVDKYMDSMDVNDLIRKNIEKSNKKRAKKGLPQLNEQQMMRNIEKEKARIAREEASKSFDKEKRDEMQAKSTEYYKNKNSNASSISSKARMVKDFNERNKK